MLCLEKIFDIKKEINHIAFRIMGLSIKIAYTVNFRQILNFQKNEIKGKTVLIIEPNDCHYETLLGYYNFLKELGYNVEILTRSKCENLFIENKLDAKIWECNSKTFDFIFKYADFSKYYCLLFNSKRIYWKGDKANNDGCDIFNCYKKIPKGRVENIYVQHHLDFFDENRAENQIVLANPTKDERLESCIVNPHYFGEINITSKNDGITKFITVGALDIKRRNSEILLKAVEILHNNNVTDFQVIVVGNGDLGDLKPELQKYFKILGRADFPTMFKALEEADYLLPLLDPSVEKHQRYMKYGTSGSFQLVYGFLKPCIIHKTFADIYGFTEKNSILYKDNNDLYKSMQDAIGLSRNIYANKQNSLEKCVKVLENISLRNLQKMLEKHPYNIVSLGDDCLIRRYLTRAGLKPTKKQGELSLPFDLCVTPTKSLIQILKNNFEDYFKDLHFSEESNIWLNQKYGIVYNHDKDCLSNEKGKLINRFQLRIENFYSIMNDPKFIFFVCKSSKNIIEILKLYFSLKRLRKKQPFKLIVLDLNRKNFKIETKKLSIYPLKHPFVCSYSWWEKIEEDESINFQKRVQSIIEKNILKEFELINYKKEDINVENGEY